MGGAPIGKQAKHQLVHTLSYGDAISTEVIALQRVFVEAGFESSIFAIHVHPHYRGASSPAVGPIRHYSELLDVLQQPGVSRGTTELIIHYSLGSPLNELFRAATGVTRSLIYHNLTPAEFFEGVNPRLVRDLRSGMNELPELVRCCDRLVADSSFNGADLKRACSETAGGNGMHVAVLPLLVEPSRWQMAANAGFSALVRGQSGMKLLHVGRIVPNKGFETLIRVLYFVRASIDPKAKLWLVGIDTDSELYSFALKQMVDAWGLTEAVEFVGQRSDCEVRALYENCTVYLCASEHEGFCLPVIEAMHFGLPVVSNAAGALPETIGGGGVLYNNLNPVEIAELVGEVCQNQVLRQKIISGGRERVKAFNAAQFAIAAREVFQVSSH